MNDPVTPDALDVVARLRWRADSLKQDADRYQAEADDAQANVNRKRDLVTALRAEAGATEAAANVLAHTGFTASIRDGLLTIEVDPLVPEGAAR